MSGHGPDSTSGGKKPQFARTPKFKVPQSQRWRDSFDVDEDLHRPAASTPYRATPTSAKSGSASKRSYVSADIASSFVFPQSTPTPSAKPGILVTAKSFQASKESDDVLDASTQLSYSSPEYSRDQEPIGSQESGGNKRRRTAVDDIEDVPSSSAVEHDDQAFHYSVLDETITIGNDGDGGDDGVLDEEGSKQHDQVGLNEDVEEEALPQRATSKTLKETNQRRPCNPPITPLRSGSTVRDAYRFITPIPSFSNPAAIPSLFATNRPPPPSTRRTVTLSTNPTFVIPPPRSPTADGADNSSRPPLPPMDWSPSHKRRQSTGAKYKPDGLASSVLGWVFDAQDAMLRSHAANSVLGFRGRQTTTSTGGMTVTISDVRKEEAYLAVKGSVRKSRNHDEVGMPVKLLLVSDSKNISAGKVVSGVNLVIGDPVWEVELDGETWRAAINWRSEDLS